MPIIRAGTRLVFYAHVPKCGGSAVQDYLHARFGSLAFEDRQHLAQPETHRWTATSPQHVDVASLNRLFPEGFFDAAFTIVRHPVARLVSAYHFQLEVERTIAPETGFSAWLDHIAQARETTPFAYDNHIRPMTELVPDGAQVFHLEHGLDALVPWLDMITGDNVGPRAVGRSNERGAHGGGGGARVVPTPEDLARIEALHGADLTRFGYEIDSRAPLSPAPVLSPKAIAARDAELRSLTARARQVKSALKRRLKGS